MSFKIRVEQIIKYYDINAAQLGVALGYGPNPAKLYRILKSDDKGPSVKIIQDILKAYPKINARWLITGESDMLLEEPMVKYEICKDCKEKDIIIKFLKEECMEKDRRIEELQKGAKSQSNEESQAS
jgi:hypothetical protein